MTMSETQEHLASIGAAEALREIPEPERIELLNDYLTELEAVLESTRAERAELKTEKKLTVSRLWLNAQVFPNDSDRWLERGDRIPEIEREIEELHGRESDIISLLDFGKRHLDAKSRTGSL